MPGHSHLYTCPPLEYEKSDSNGLVLFVFKHAISVYSSCLPSDL